MDFRVRETERRDAPAWGRMRAALWPDETLDMHAEGIDRILASDDRWGFIVETAEGAPIGFAEVAVRKYANGCRTQPVPFLEGIWVEERFRRRGVGTRLIAFIEGALVARGFCELGSDTQIDNFGSQAAHRGWGFSETERVVYFRKDLAGAEPRPA